MGLRADQDARIPEGNRSGADSLLEYASTPVCHPIAGEGGSSPLSSPFLPKRDSNPPVTLFSN
jgi:hypothetical protein